MTANTCRWLSNDLLRIASANGVEHDYEITEEPGLITLTRWATEAELARTGRSTVQYTIQINGRAWSCSCPHSQHRRTACKHSRAIRAAMAALPL